MILRFSIEGGPCALLDDEQTDTRMTPEIVDDYMRRLRSHAMQAYEEMVTFDRALDRAADETTTGD